MAISLRAWLLHPIHDNPVAQAEQQHQARAGRRRGIWLFNLMFVLALIFGAVALLLTGAVDWLAAQAGVPVADVEDALTAVLSFAALLIGMLLFAQHVLIVSQAVQVTAGTIVREKQARTWESLILTGIDARQIVRGKWRASLRLLWAAHRRALWLRLAGIVGPMVIGATSDLVNVAPLDLRVLAVIVVFGMGLVVINVLLAAGIGLLGSALGRGPAMASQLASGLHFGFILLSVLLFFAWIIVDPSAFRYDGAGIGVLMSPLDGGSVVIWSLIGGYEALDRLGGVLLGGSIAVGVYAALIWGVLRLTEWVIVRQGATPHQQAAAQGAPVWGRVRRIWPPIFGAGSPNQRTDQRRAERVQ
ncbi:MAG: hypothetical protein GYB67_19215 [Chloroflexi bacterium]|nr:hypothetical protein [Chloroflexota bacterium]